MRRVVRNYDGCKTTSRKLREVLPSFLKKLDYLLSEKSDLVLKAWPEVIGIELSKMTEACQFREGTLVVKVTNSSLFSLLNTYEKKRLLAKLKAKFPDLKINQIIFRMG